MKHIVEKKLSPNDIGLTGSHQAGILVPKRSELLSFFPTLPANQINPRIVIRFYDDLDQLWKFNFIYYNNKLRGGTRNEYRLTGMTSFLRGASASVDDILVFEKNEDDYLIRIKKAGATIEETEDGVVTLVLDNSWRIISF